MASRRDTVSRALPFGFQVAREALDIGAANGEQGDAALVAPRGELT